MKPSVVLLTCLFACVPASAATIYDLVNDLAANPTANPNGAWAFLSGSTPVNYFANEVALGGAPGFSPANGYGVFLPIFWTCPDGVCVHSVDSGNGNSATGEARITWTSPADGMIDISGYIFYDQSSLQRSNDFNLALGAGTLDTGTASYVTHYDSGHAYAFSHSALAVTTGDVLALQLARTPGEQFGTIAAVNLTVAFTEAETPEPGTAGLALAALGGLSAVIRRRKGRQN